MTETKQNSLAVCCFNLARHSKYHARISSLEIPAMDLGCMAMNFSYSLVANNGR